jgi:drug/metabolite transporter (DMT)-like permease
MATSIKLVGTRYPVGEIVFFRSFFALIPVFVWVIVRDRRLDSPLRIFRTGNIRGHLARSTVGVVAMSLGFTGLTLLPIADATAIGYAAPLVTVVFAVLILHEKVHIFRWTAVIVGLIGVLIILSDFFGPEARAGERSAFGATVAMGSAFMAALAITFTRRLATSEPAATIVVYFSSLSAFFGFLSLPILGWVTPNWQDALTLVGAGVFGGIGQVLLTQSYRFGNASTIAPFEYSSMIWVLTVSLVIFGAWPSGRVLVGTAIVISAGLFVIWREHRLGIERARSKRAQTPTSPLS